MKDIISKLTLGQKVREARILNKMTQKELAGDFITRNMLSQIENNSATPSIKTIEYIAKKLDKPIGYFVDHEINEKYEVTLVEEVLIEFNKCNYTSCINTIELFFENNQKARSNDLLKKIYMNCCLKAASTYKSSGDYKNAKKFYQKALNCDTDLRFESDGVLYNIYSQLAEVNAYLNIVDEAKTSDDKAKDILNKMVASRVIQSIYILFIEGKYSDVIERIKALDIDELDEYNKGRSYMIIGSTYYYKEDYKQAIKYLEKAIPYYQNMTCGSNIIMIYQELSKCYFNLENYKKAYEYLQLTQIKH